MQNKVGEDKEEVETHVDEPLQHQHHPDGFTPAPEEHSPNQAPEVQGEENKDSVPILTADEVDPAREHSQPAISPTFERRSSNHGLEPDELGDKDHCRPGNATDNITNPEPQVSYPSLTKYGGKEEDNEEIPNRLNDVEEYEPHFADGDKEVSEKRFKRPTEPLQHTFPSKDMWEDPNSLQHETAVTSHGIPKEPRGHDDPEIAKDGIDPTKLVKPKKQAEVETPSYLPDSKPAETTTQRFPSRDIWEEAPESQKLVATAQEPEPENEVTSPAVPVKPVTPARPSKRPSQPSPEDDQPKVAGPSAETQKPPIAPGSKPQLPTRPPRPRKADADGESLAKMTSGGSEEQPEATTKPAIKPKPAIPARPAGSKISNLKTGFLSDLNDRLKLGPKPPPAPEKKEEPEAPPAEKGPLSDARKGRARGPARRKPPVARAAAPEQEAKPAATEAPEIKLVDPWNVWHIAENGAVAVQEGMAESSKAVSGGSSSGPAVAAEMTSATEASREPEKPASSKDEVGREAPDVAPVAAEATSPREATREAEQPASSKDEVVHEAPGEQKDSEGSEDARDSKLEPQSSGAELQQDTVPDAEALPETQETPSEKEPAEEPQSPEVAGDQTSEGGSRKDSGRLVSPDEDDKAATFVP